MTMIELHLGLSMAIGIYIIVRPAADLLHDMSGLHLAPPMTMGILQGCAPWRTLLKLIAIYAANSLASYRVVENPTIIELQSGREVIFKLLTH